MSKLLFLGNSYNILGLETDATEKDIIRRAKEIANLLKIDEQPEYPHDIFFKKDIRTAASVEKARQNLLDDKKQIKEFYFWFSLSDNTDEKAIAALHDEDILSCLQLLTKKSKNNTNDYVTLKNLAIAESIAFTVKKQKKYLHDSVKHWAKLLASDTAWSSFKKLLGLIDNFNLDEAAIQTFQHRTAAQYLSDFYASMSKELNDPSIYATFSDKTNVKNGQVISSMVEPILSEILDTAKELASKQYKYNNEHQLVYDDYRYIKNQLYKIQTLLTQLESMGSSIWSNPKTITVRDDVANLLRSTSVELFNKIDVAENIDDYMLSLSLVEEGKKISGSSSTKIRLSNDVTKVIQLQAREATFRSVSNMVRAERFGEALEIIDKNISKLDEKDQAVLLEIRDDIKQAHPEAQFYVNWIERKAKNGTETSRETRKALGKSHIKTEMFSTPHTPPETQKQSGSGASRLFWLIVIVLALVVFLLNNKNNKIEDAVEACQSSNNLNSSSCQLVQDKYGKECYYSGSYPYRYIHCE